VNDKKTREELTELYKKAEEAKGRPEELMTAIFGPIDRSGDEQRHPVTVEELRATNNRYIKDRLEFDKEIITAKNKLAALEKKMTNIWKVQEIDRELERSSSDFAKANNRRRVKLSERKTLLREDIETSERMLYGNHRGSSISSWSCYKGWIAQEYIKKAKILREQKFATQKEVDQFLCKHNEALVKRYIPEIDIVQHLLTRRGYLDKPGVAKGAWRYPDLGPEAINESR